MQAIKLAAMEHIAMNALLKIFGAIGLTVNPLAVFERAKSATAGINKYTPHQGKRECARRVAQAAKLAAKKGGL